ncbi:MAG TPA: efflux RND transporter periplasmic adaptor subunit [Gemmatimonadaceae bacterium]|nr:efflux RND transporter periplasmic adaptor subunit [Gemmatimonadaceae bacterium]
MHLNKPLLTIAFMAAILGGCSKGSTEEASARPAGAAGKAGGRGPQMLTLAEGDVTIAKRSSMVDGVPVTGNLRPIETVDIRARLEGVLQGVYVREGDVVRTGQLLARFESSGQESNLQSAAADKASAENELATAQWRLTQSEQLFKQGAIAEEELRTARSAVGAARARLAATNARVRTSALTTRDTRVLATTSGTIEKRFAEPGEHISNGGQLFTLVRNDVLELAASVPERVANSVAPGQSVQFLANGRSFVGRVARVSPTVDPATRSVTVYVQVPNNQGLLKGGTFATGTVLTRAIASTVVVPVAALHQTVSGATVVYKIVKGMVDTASVKVGVVDDRAGIAEAVSGVTEGDSIVSGNVGSLGKGMKVQIVNARGPGGRGKAGTKAGSPK